MILEIKIHIQNKLSEEELNVIQGASEEEIIDRLAEMKNDLINYFKREGVEGDSAFKEFTVEIVR